MMLPPLRLVVPDGTGPLPQLATTIPPVPFGCDFDQPVTVVHASGAPYDLTGNVFAAQGFKKRISDDAPFFQKSWTKTGLNTAVFGYTKAEYSTLLLPRSYATTIQFLDQDTGFEDTILLPSRFTITPVGADLSLMSIPTPPILYTFNCVLGVNLIDLVYVSSNDTVDKADASNQATKPAFGFVQQVLTSTSVVVQQTGELNGFSGLVAGTVYYADPLTPGGITSDISRFVPGTWQQRVAVARNSSTIDIKMGALDLFVRT